MSFTYLLIFLKYRFLGEVDSSPTARKEPQGEKKMVL